MRTRLNISLFIFSLTLPFGTLLGQERTLVSEDSSVTISYSSAYKGVWYDFPPSGCLPLEKVDKDGKAYIEFPPFRMNLYVNDLFMQEYKKEISSINQKVHTYSFQLDSTDDSFDFLEALLEHYYRCLEVCSHNSDVFKSKDETLFISDSISWSDMGVIFAHSSYFSNQNGFTINDSIKNDIAKNIITQLETLSEKREKEEASVAFNNFLVKITGKNTETLEIGLAIYFSAWLESQIILLETIEKWPNEIVFQDVLLNSKVTIARLLLLFENCSDTKLPHDLLHLNDLFISENEY